MKNDEPSGEVDACAVSLVQSVIARADWRGDDPWLAGVGVSAFGPVSRASLL
jgi:hypothetical protein